MSSVPAALHVALLLAGAGSAVAAGARCLAGACPGSEAPSLLQVGGSRARTGGGSSAPQRLHVLTVTGPGEHERFAIQAWEHVKAYIGPHDNYTNVCEVGCGMLTADGRSLSHMLPMTSDAFPSGSCRTPEGECSGWDNAAMKWPWGLISEWNARRTAGAPMPRWWFLRDDDTYFRADRLMDLVHDVDPMAEPAIVGSEGLLIDGVPRRVHWEGPDCKRTRRPGMWQGGAGVLLSAALVEALVTRHAERWLRLQEKQIRLGCSYYDHVLGSAVSWVDGVRKLSYPEVFVARWGTSPSEIPKDIDALINEQTVSYHMGPTRKALGDAVALAKVSKAFF